jgi:hypothetical protein
MMPLAAALALSPVVLQARILWVDMSANLEWTIHADEVEAFCKRAAEVGFNEIVLDVKSINGKRLFGPPGPDRLTRFRGIAIPEGYDLLKVFAEAAHRHGLRICADFNVFSEGHSHFPGEGLAYENPAAQTQIATPYHEIVLRDGTVYQVSATGAPRDGVVVVAQGSEGVLLPEVGYRIRLTDADAARLAAVGIAQYRYGMKTLPQTVALPNQVAVFVDPLAPGVRERALELFRMAAKYPIDGIVFDRMRFSDLAAGFGPAMREAFEKRYGKVSSWPDSVLSANPVPGRPPLIGPRFAEFQQFRAEVITEFLRDAREAIHSVNPRLTLGSYVGGGWETYYQVGVNYATDRPEPPYPWARDEYGLAGYAAYLDYLMTGCFYPVAREVDATIQGRRERFTVEGCARLMVGLAGEGTLVYPSLYGLDWEGKSPEELKSAIRACLESGDGIMFFDAVYIRRNDWWEVFREAFGGAEAVAPHALRSYPRRTGLSKTGK